MPRPTVAVLAYQGMSAFETGIVTEVFGLPRPEFDVPWYELAVCAERPRPLPLIGGALLRQRYPLVKVDPDVLYIDDGEILTSAGSAAGLDLCVHLIRRDFGPAIANAVARRLVIPPHRDGGQAQFIEAPMVADPDDDRI